MPELEELIANWRREMVRSLPGGSDAITELEDHLRERVGRLIADGRSPTDAFVHASRELGSAADLAPQFAWVIPKESRITKAIRVPLTVLLGPYLALMGLQFAAICFHLIRAGISPFAAEAPAAFFTNFIACLGSATILWLLWRGRKTRAKSRQLAEHA